MPYIGRDLNRGNYLKLDDISSSFNGNTQTFNLTVGGSAFTPGSAFSILVSVGGVIQEPESAYQVENSEITFANAPTAQDSFFCIALGVALGIGVPGNGTVNGAHLAKPFNYDGFFYLNDGTNRVGINSSIPSETLDIVGNAKISGILTASSYSGPISNPSGISTFYNLKVTNNLTVEGSTTTLDTVVTEVDKLEVAANNTTVGVAITQSGTGDILNLYDGSSEVFSVTDGGITKIKKGLQIIPETNSLYALDGTLSYYGTTNGVYLNGAGASGWLRLNASGVTNDRTAINLYGQNMGGFGDQIRIKTASEERIKIGSDGKIGINTTTTSHLLTVSALAANTVIARFKALNQNSNFDIFTDASSHGQAYVRNNIGAATVKLNSNGDSYFTGGSVGIGTDNPGTLLHLSSSNPIIRLTDTDNNAYSAIGGESGFLYLYTNSTARDFIFRGTGEVARLTGDGLLGIGTNNPTSTLEINNVSPKIVLRDSDNGADVSIHNVGGAAVYSSNSDALFQKTDATEMFRVGTNGNVYFAGTQSGNNRGILYNAAGYFGMFGSSSSGVSRELRFFRSSAAGSEVMRLVSTGVTLHSANGGGVIYGDDGATGVLKLQSTSGNNNHARVDVGVNESDNGGVHFYTAGSSVAERRITIKGTTGRVGIGTDNPTQTLHVRGHGVFTRQTGGTITNGLFLDSGDTGQGNRPDIILKGSGSAGLNQLAMQVYYNNGSNKAFHLRYDGGTYHGGNIGIGSESPGRPLTITAADARIRLQDSDTGGHAEIYTDNSHSLHFGADSSSSSGSSNMLFEFNGTEAVRIRESGGDILYGEGDHIVGADPGLINGLGSHHNNNVGSVLYGVNDGGGFNGMKVENFDDGTYNSQRIKFLTGKGGYSMATVRMGINENGQVSIGSTTTTEAGSNTKLVVFGSGTPGITPSSIAASTLATFRMTGGLSHAAGVSILGGSTGSSALNLGDRDNELIGRIIYSHTSGNATDYMAFYAQGAERVRISADGGTAISKGGNPHADSGWAGLEVRSAQNTHQLVLSSTDNAANSNQVRLGFKLHPSYQNERTKAAIVCQGSGGGYGEVDRMMFCIDSAADNGSADGNGIDEKLRITSSGELIIYPTASSNQNTSIRFANSASTPFMVFKSNNVSDAAEIRVPEDNSGAHMQLKTKRRTGADNAGTLRTVLDLDPYGSVYTGDISGTAKTYPVIGGDTIGTGGEIGQVNYNDIRSPQGSIGGWVELGIDYNGAHPWPPRAYKIAQHENGRNCTRVYHIWHDGDANFHYGGMWEVRINEWGSTSNKFESVHFRCINGRRTDLSLLVYDNTDGIWIRPHTIWGKLHIRRAGWDNSGRAIGSSYCAVTNSGALAFGDTLGANGSIPSGYFELYPFDGAGGSHTGGRYIENNTNSDG